MRLSWQPHPSGTKSFNRFYKLFFCFVCLFLLPLPTTLDWFTIKRFRTRNTTTTTRIKLSNYSANLRVLTLLLRGCMPLLCVCVCRGGGGGGGLHATLWGRGRMWGGRMRAGLRVCGRAGGLAGGCVRACVRVWNHLLYKCSKTQQSNLHWLIQLSVTHVTRRTPFVPQVGSEQ